MLKNTLSPYFFFSVGQVCPKSMNFGVGATKTGDFIAYFHLRLIRFIPLVDMFFLSSEKTLHTSPAVNAPVSISLSAPCGWRSMAKAEKISPTFRLCQNPLSQTPCF